MFKANFDGFKPFFPHKKQTGAFIRDGAFIRINTVYAYHFSLTFGSISFSIDDTNISIIFLCRSIYISVPLYECDSKYTPQNLTMCLDQLIH